MPTVACRVAGVVHNWLHVTQGMYGRDCVTGDSRVHCSYTNYSNHNCMTQDIVHRIGKSMTWVLKRSDQYNGLGEWSESQVTQSTGSLSKLKTTFLQRWTRPRTHSPFTNLAKTPMDCVACYLCLGLCAKTAARSTSWRYRVSAATERQSIAILFKTLGKKQTVIVQSIIKSTKLSHPSYPILSRMRSSL